MREREREREKYYMARQKATVSYGEGRRGREWPGLFFHNNLLMRGSKVIISIFFSRKF
jgi:hypothetical protein